MRREDDPLVKQMQRWGAVQVTRHRGAGYGAHPLDEAAEDAPGTVAAAMSQLLGRDGTARRRLMAQQSGVQGLRMVPEWAVDPIKAHNDADPPRALAAPDVETPDELRWIDRAIAEIHRQNRMRAEVLAIEFSEVGTQERKARILAHRYGGKLSVHQYRRELRLAMDWLRLRSGHASAA